MRRRLQPSSAQHRRAVAAEARGGGGGEGFAPSKRTGWPTTGARPRTGCGRSVTRPRAAACALAAACGDVPDRRGRQALGAEGATASSVVRPRRPGLDRGAELGLVRACGSRRWRSAGRRRAPGGRSARRGAGTGGRSGRRSPPARRWSRSSRTGSRAGGGCRPAPAACRRRGGARGWSSASRRARRTSRRRASRPAPVALRWTRAARIDQLAKRPAIRSATLSPALSGAPPSSPVAAMRPGHRLHDEVVGGEVAERAFLAEARDRAVDQARVRGAQRLGAEAEPGGDAGAEVLDHDVDARGDLLRQREVGRVLEVERRGSACRGC